MNGITTFANPKMTSLLGTSTDEIEGRSLFDFVHLSDQVTARTRMGQRHRGVSEQYECALRTADGATIDVLISTSPLNDGDGQVSGVFKMVTDVSARKCPEALNANLEFDREWADRLASLGPLAGGVAHDFSNLLGVISNYATLLTTQTTDRQMLSDLHEIDNATMRAASLTRQLLAFARQDIEEPQFIELNDLLRQHSQLLNRTLGEHIELTLELEESSPNVSSCSPTRISSNRCC